MTCDCELCKFNNPKATATGVIIRDNKVLLLKRNHEPFKGMWDFTGGYMEERELPEEALKRELKEELGVEVGALTFMRSKPGSASWKDFTFPILSHFYLCDIGDAAITLNDENTAYQWVALKELRPEEVAFDSNQVVARWLKERFTFDLERVRALVSQLDPTAILDEQSLYKAMLQGFLATRYDGELLVGLGWIFPRQTLLRRQAVVEDMIVDEAYRGRGLGKAILQDLLTWAKEQSMDMVELTTNPKRLAANELYKAMGFWLHPTNHYLYNVRKD